MWIPDVWWTCPSPLRSELTNISWRFFSLRLYRILPRPYKYIGVVCFALSFIRSIGSIYLTIQAVTAQSCAINRLIDFTICMSFIQHSAHNSSLIVSQALAYWRGILVSILSVSLLNHFPPSISAVALLIGVSICRWSPQLIYWPNI